MKKILIIFLLVSSLLYAESIHLRMHAYVDKDIEKIERVQTDSTIAVIVTAR